MGRGNWRPSMDDESYRLRYFDLYEMYKPVGQDEWEGPEHWDWDHFLRDFLTETLPDSFYVYEKGFYKPDTVASGCHVVAYNRLVALVVEEDANAHHVGVALVCLDHGFDDPSRDALSREYINRHGSAIFKRIGGAQYVRTSAWTSQRVTDGATFAPLEG